MHSPSPRALCLLAFLVLLIISTMASYLPAAEQVTSIQQAYNQANNGDIILIHSAIFAEELLLNRSIGVTFDGGYTDTTYTTKGSATTLHGALTISDGTLTVADFVIGGAAGSGTAPVISNAEFLSPDIIWTTDQPADSRVDYGETASYDNSVTAPQLVTSHRLTLTGLQVNTTYHYRIITTNAAGQGTSSADATFTTPPFIAVPLIDLDTVTVMEASGSFDTNNQDGSLNTFPRQEIARSFIRNHSDDYDFLVLLTTFPVTMPTSETKGLYTAIKNNVQGIGQNIFDNSSLFGSQGKLQGVVDLGDITALVTNQTAEEIDQKLTVLAHELMHRWGAYVRYQQAGSSSTALLGEDLSHWSYLLDSSASVMYGNSWQNNGDGTYTATGIWNRYSDLDLYLMGMIPKEQVPPMLLIANPAIAPATKSLAGATITGTATTVTIDDIIAAEGSRVPAIAQAQKQFKIGYILLTRPGTEPGNAPATTETIRSAFAGRFAQMTNGAGKTLDVAPTLNIIMTAPVSGTTVTGPDTTIKGTVINSTGAETGVTINGVPAIIIDSSFVANGVPLQEGTNPIIITATDANGLTASTTSVVTAQLGPYIRLHANTGSGLAPLDLILTIDGSFSIDSSELYSSGPADVELTADPTPNEYSLRFPAEGTYILTAYVTGQDGQAYEDDLTITVQSLLGLDRVLKQKWEGMKTALASNNVANAVSFFNEPSQSKYQAIFQELSGSLAGIAANMEPIELDYAHQDIAEYQISRSEDIDGQLQEITYFIYFVRDKDGLWKLNQM